MSRIVFILLAVLAAGGAVLAMQSSQTVVSTWLAIGLGVASALLVGVACCFGPREIEGDWP